MARRSYREIPAIAEFTIRDGGRVRLQPSLIDPVENPRNGIRRRGLARKKAGLDKTAMDRVLLDG
jgi:hypothetical protein